MFDKITVDTKVTDWKEYGKVMRANGGNLFRRLNDFPDSIFVTGCQRSGTTMTGKVLGQSSELVDYSVNLYASGPEISHDAALILYGYIEHTPRGRYCFQTTWLNDNYHEYFNLSHGQKMIWVIRNPYSVVRSMLRNWAPWALDELFRQCGVKMLTGTNKLIFNFLSTAVIDKFQQAYFSYNGKGARVLMRDRITRNKLLFVDYDDTLRFRGLNQLKRACFAYNGKVSQVFDLTRKLSGDTLLVVDYDDLVMNKDKQLPKIFDFAQLSYKPEFSDMIRSSSLNKKKDLSDHEFETIKTLCEPVYEQARKLVSI